VAQTLTPFHLPGQRSVNRIPCGPGVGVGVCPALRRLVTSNLEDSTLSVHRMDQVGFPMVRQVGGPGSGPLEFHWVDADGFPSGWVCFTVPGDGSRPTLLVADHGNDRVQEVREDGVRGGGGACVCPPSPAACAVLG
jgi:hypothetical protein